MLIAGSVIFALIIFKDSFIPASNDAGDDIAFYEKDITPGNMNGVRPDVIKAGDSFYINFLQTEPKRSLGMIKVDSRLNTQYLGEIYSGQDGSNPTDARMAVDGKNNIWYSFEAVYSGPDKNYLNLARYGADGRTLELIDTKDKIAQGVLASPEINKFPESGSEQVDDPLPFYYSGKYYVMTRTFQSPVYKVRVFDNSFNLIDSYSLDLAPAIGQNALSVNSLVEIEGEIYMITGVFNNRPPGDPEAISKIVAIPLQKDLREAKGDKIELTNGKKYSSYVSSAKYKDGKLYVLYNNFIGKTGNNLHEGVLEIYDAKNNFSRIRAIKINGGKMIDNHMTMEFMGDRLYVLYNTPEEKLFVKVFALKEIQTNKFSLPLTFFNSLVNIKTSLISNLKQKKDR